MKKLIVSVLAALFILLSFSASLHADIMSWEDRQKLNDQTVVRPAGDEDGWADLKGGIAPGTDYHDDIEVTSTLLDMIAPVINMILTPALERNSPPELKDDLLK